ncbi:hypothetical protein [Nocardia sp. NPDC057440]|uniref:hypothetical protein n=1 Tax=Nocardia sp. NPDC057440 TaxID=3346134 RepID=UPI00366B8837
MVSERITRFADVSGPGTNTIVQGDRDFTPGWDWTMSPNSLGLSGNSPHSSAGGPIFGIDTQTGATLSFRPEDIYSVGLHDADGRPLGVLFPETDHDVANIPRWASMRNRDSDLYYRDAYQISPATQNSHARWQYSERRDAAWQREVQRTGRPPLYIISHSYPESHLVQVDINGERRRVFVDGSGYGPAVAGNEHTLEAVEDNPESPVVLVSCSPAQTGSATAQFSAEYLINEGEMDRDIHTAKSILILPRDEDIGWSWLGSEALFDRSGRQLQTFESYWGSPYSAGRSDLPKQY